MRRATLYAPSLREPPRDLEPSGQRALARAGWLRLDAKGYPVLLPLGALALARLVSRIEQAWAPLAPTRLALGGPALTERWLAVIARDVRSYRELPLAHLFAGELRPEAAPGRMGLLAAARASELTLRLASGSAEELAQRLTLAGDGIRKLVAALGVPTRELRRPLAAGVEERLFIADAPGSEVEALRCPVGCAPAVVRDSASLPAARSGPEAPLSGEAPRRVDTPGAHTVQEVARFLDVSPASILKTLVVELDGQLHAALIPGDRELSLTKLAAATGARQVGLAPEARVRAATGAPLGFAGPVGLALPLWVDHAIAEGAAWVTGANAADAHLVGVVAGRDFSRSPAADLCVAAPGDPCPVCGAAQLLDRGVVAWTSLDEGTSATSANGWTVDRAHGGEGPVWTAAISVRPAVLLGLAAEAAVSEPGLAWPIGGAAPVEVSITPIGPPDGPAYPLATALEEALERAGVPVIMDDRDLRAGQKLGDVDLHGWPIAIVIGAQGIARGTAEVRVARPRHREDLPFADVPGWVAIRQAQGAH